MFKCSLTKKVSQPGEKPVKIVTKRRNKQYFNRDKELVADGWEIVEEKLVSQEAIQIKTK